MTDKAAYRAKAIIEELEELDGYKRLVEDKEYGKSLHFELVNHYGNSPRKIIVSDKHTKRLIIEVEKIISELRQELSDLQ